MLSKLFPERLPSTWRLGLLLAVLMACMLTLWLISIALKDVSFIDSFWAASVPATSIVGSASA